jgi:hypothetical protein
MSLHAGEPMQPQDEKAVSPKMLRAGDRCEIILVAQTTSSNRTTGQIVGTVLRTADDQIVLTDAWRTGRTERGVPILSKIPYANRLFKSVGIGREKIADTEYPVPLERISFVRLLPSDSPGESPNAQ